VILLGGRGGSSGITSKSGVRKVDGIRGSVFSTFSEVTKQSQNTIWIANTNRPHALIKDGKKEMHLQGDKRNKYGLLDNVNAAVVHLSGIDSGDSKREVSRLNKQLSEIKSLGFDVPRVNVGRDETVVYVKRKLATRRY
jgi:hypothetical protein